MIKNKAGFMGDKLWGKESDNKYILFFDIFHAMQQIPNLVFIKTVWPATLLKNQIQGRFRFIHQ